MLCPTGLALFEQYEIAARERIARKADAPATGREARLAKQRNVEKFADWMGHKAFCQDCKPRAPARGELRSTRPGG